MPPPPSISVVIPFYQAAGTLLACLEAIKRSNVQAMEIFCVDDGSTDNGADICRACGATVIAMPANGGPGKARNAGARRAASDIVLFIDADVVVGPDAIGKVANYFNENPDCDAVFGSYDTAPSDPSFLSQYRNLLHHYVHQTSCIDAHTFWAGCGAVRRAKFFEAGGFDEGSYALPTVEDIELGLRMTAAGCRIRIDRSLQVTHLKRWSWGKMLYTDIMMRALPWSMLIADGHGLVSQLNVSWPERLRAASANLFVLSVAAIPLLNSSLYLSAALLAIYIWLNRRCYLFFLRERGAWFALRVIPVHMLYYIYSSAVLATVLAWKLILPGTFRIARQPR